MRYLIPLIIIILITSSCRKLVQDKFDDFEKKATINSFLTADSVLQIHLSETGAIGEGGIKYIENADVNIYINNLSIKLDYLGEGKYYSNTIVKPNAHYLCEIIINNESVTASCYIPAKPILNSVEVTEDAWLNENGELSPAVRFELQNSPNDSLYFEAFMTVLTEKVENAVFDTITWEIISSDTIYYIEGSYSIGLFSNIEENANTITKNIAFTLTSYSFPKPVYLYVFEMRALSKSAYKYMQSMELYNLGANPEFGSATPPPYNLYSNVNNGYGIFGGYSATVADTITGN